MTQATTILTRAACSMAPRLNSELYLLHFDMNTPLCLSSGSFEVSAKSGWNPYARKSLSRTPFWFIFAPT